MHLKSLSLINYKNLESATFDFDSKINCFVGANGVGKTNVLDAIYLLAFGKSYFNPIAIQNINHNADFFVVDGNFIKAEKDEKIIVSLKKGQKKIIKRNGKLYKKFSEHLGLIPLVIISPMDRDIIIEGSETRRKFMDSVISQGDSTYLSQLIAYNKLISQRNALLKYFALNHTFNADTLDIYNLQLDDLGSKIFKKRTEFLELFVPLFIKRYQDIVKQNKDVNIHYKSDLFDARLIELFEKNLNKDKILQHTNKGIHKDDLVFLIDNYPIKKFGSQGQQKSFLIALKLAQFDILKKKTNTAPILLLDDIFDKLDEHRVTQIIRLVDQEDFGQIFISDTHPNRTETVVKQTHQSYNIFNL